MQLDLKNLLANKDITNKDKVLVVLASGSTDVKKVSEIRDLAVQNGLRVAKKWNISQYLTALDGLAVRLSEGWSITDKGKSHLHTLGVTTPSPTQVIQPTLRNYALKISDSNVQAFVLEAIGAIEVKLFRAAVVLSWVGATAVLYELVLKNHLSAFNAEALARNPKWKAATTRDDLTRMKEFDFLQILGSISVLGKNTREELEHCLKLRNTCGHPNSHGIGENRVAAHIETLILNVFSKFSI